MENPMQLTMDEIRTGLQMAIQQEPEYSTMRAIANMLFQQLADLEKISTLAKQAEEQMLEQHLTVTATRIQILFQGYMNLNLLAIHEVVSLYEGYFQQMKAAKEGLNVEGALLSTAEMRMILQRVIEEEKAAPYFRVTADRLIKQLDDSEESLVHAFRQADLETKLEGDVKANMTRYISTQTYTETVYHVYQTIVKQFTGYLEDYLKEKESNEQP